MFKYKIDRYLIRAGYACVRNVMHVPTYNLSYCPSQSCLLTLLALAVVACICFTQWRFSVKNSFLPQKVFSHTSKLSFSVANIRDPLPLV